jgi:spermidine/putrescine-binding protein
MRFPEDSGDIDVVSLLAEGEVAAAMGYGVDYLEIRKTNDQVRYILPEEGPFIWFEAFVVPASSQNRAGAEALLNYFLRPEVAAQIANYNYYATPNETAWPLIDAEIFNDPVIFPPNDALRTAEIINPLSAWGEGLYATIWERFREGTR